MFIALFDQLGIAEYQNRQKIELLEWYLKQLPQAKNMRDYDYIHTFADGVYTRTIHIPAGDLVIGYVHKTRHWNYLIKGHASIVCDDTLYDEHGPFCFESPAETKKAVYAHTDVIYATRHYTDKTNLDEIMQDTVYDSDLSWIEVLP